MKTSSRIVLLLCGLWLTLIACNRIPRALPPSPVTGATPQPTNNPAAYPEPGENTTPNGESALPQEIGGQTILLPIIPGPPASLPPQGPWVLLRADRDLSIMGLAGGDPLLLTDQFIGPPDLAATISPTGRHLAFLTAADNQFHRLTLHVVSLPERKSLLSLPLTTPETEPGSTAGPGEPQFEIARAMATLDNLAWSPDGRQLAFTGAQDGTSADVYLYDLAGGQVRRLSQEFGQAIRPAWSPDGRKLVYAGVSSLGTGAGYGMTGLWALPLDGSEPQAIDYPENSGNERLLGWAGPETALLYSFEVRCGYRNLRAVNLNTGQVRVFWAGAFQAIGFDPVSAKVLLSVAALDETCNPGRVQGLLLTHPEAQDALLVGGPNALEIVWSPAAGQFLAATPEGVWAVDPFGRQTLLPGAFDRVPVFAPSGRRYVWAQTDFQGIPGIWLGEAATVPEQIYNGRAQLPIWNPADGQLYFFNNEGFFRSDFETPPVLIASIPGVADAVLIQSKP